jgi:tetratricopeptide (TPR) repeat protein
VRAGLLEYQDAAGQNRRGSCYVLGRGLVLTARHCVAQASGHRVHLGAGQVPAAAEVVWESGHEQVDLALLRAEAFADWSLVPLARIQPGVNRVENCRCEGYPAFMSDPKGSEGGREDRLAVLDGRARLVHVGRSSENVASPMRGQFVADPGRSDMHRAEVDPDKVWRGISGAAVVARSRGIEYCLGVTASRRSPEAGGQFNFTVFDAVAELEGSTAGEFWGLVGVTGPDGLTVLPDDAAQPGPAVKRASRNPVVRVPSWPGRADGLVERAQFREVRDGVLGGEGPHRFTLTGFRGTGKSQIAAAVCRSCADADWPVVSWIDARSEAAINEGLWRAADALGIAFEGDQPRQTVCRLIDHWNQHPDRRRLLVLDDLRDMADLTGLGIAPGAATLVITSAHPNVRDRAPIEVDVFGLDEAVDCLEGQTGLGDRAGASAVAERLSRHPLSLSQAAWVIRHRRLAYEVYLKELDGLAKGLRVPDDLFEATPDADAPYYSTAYEAIALSVKTALASARRRDVVQGLLDTFSVLDGSDLAVDWLTPLVAAFDLNTALTVLSDAALVRRSNNERVGRMHGVVAIVIQELNRQAGRLTPVGGDKLVRGVSVEDDATAAPVQVLAQVDPTDNTTYPDYGRQRETATDLARHLAAFWSNAGRSARVAEVIPAASRCGAALRDLGDPYTGAAVAELASAVCLGVLGPHHPDTLKSQNGLALAHRAMGRLKEAIRLHEVVLADRERLLGRDHPDTLKTCANLALAYRSAGRVEDGVRLYEAVLADRVRVLAPDDPDILNSQNSLALAYRSAGRLDEAITLHEANLAARERVLGPDHRDTLKSRSNLAGALMEAGRLDKAISLHEANLADRGRVLGPDHPDTLRSLNNLAFAYRLAGRLDEAITLHEANLADRERVLGPDHPETLTSRNNLGESYRLAGRLEKAVGLCESNLADSERVLGSIHPHTLRSRNNLAFAYRSAGRLDEAISLFETNLADRDRVLGPDHPDTLRSRNNLAVAYRSAGRLDEATSLFETNLADRDRVLGPDHPDTLRTRNNLAFTYRLAGWLGDAVRQHEAVLADRERVLGPEHPDTSRSRANLAQALVEWERPDEARSVLEPALSAVATLDPRHDVRRSVEELAVSLGLDVDRAT